MENTTSSAVTAEPLWNTAPSRSAMSTNVPVALGSSLARAAYTSRLAGSTSVRPSMTCQFAAMVRADEVVIGSYPLVPT